jgi:hypothetical protein
MYAYLDKRNGEEEERERRKERGKERGLLSRHNHLLKLRAASSLTQEELPLPLCFLSLPCVSE